MWETKWSRLCSCINYANSESYFVPREMSAGWLKTLYFHTSMHCVHISFFVIFFLFLSNETPQIKVPRGAGGWGECDVITIKCPFRWQFPMFQNNKAIHGKHKKSTLQTLLFEVSPPSGTSITHALSAVFCIAFENFPRRLANDDFFLNWKFGNCKGGRCTSRVVDVRGLFQKRTWMDLMETLTDGIFWKKKSKKRSVLLFDAWMDDPL